MNLLQHRTAAKRARAAALDSDISAIVAEERGDQIAAAEATDELLFQVACAEHHEAMAAYEASITQEITLLPTHITTITHE